MYPSEKPTLDETKDLVFQILSWEAYDRGVLAPEKCVDESRAYTVYACGKTADGIGVTLCTEFRPYFLIRLTNDENETPWTQEEINQLIGNDLLFKGYGGDDEDASFKSRYFKAEHQFVSFQSAYYKCEQIWLKDIDAGFTGIVPKQFQFLKMTFTTHAAAKACARRVCKSQWGARPIALYQRLSFFVFFAKR
jgi:hypothetical protein